MCAPACVHNSRVVIERAQLEVLRWGPGEDLSRTMLQHPDGFDVIVGADIAYAAAFTAALVATLASLLAHQPQVVLYGCCLRVLQFYASQVVCGKCYAL